MTPLEDRKTAEWRKATRGREAKILKPISFQKKIIIINNNQLKITWQSYN